MNRDAVILKDLSMNEDAILGTLAYLKSIGINYKQYEKVETLMRLSYERGMIIEEMQRAYFTRVQERAEEGTDGGREGV